MLKQLNTSDYYMGLASVQFMDETLKTLQPSLDKLVPKGPLTTDDVATVKELVKQYSDCSAQIKNDLNNVDKKELVAFADLQNSSVPLAYADDEGYGQKALGFLKSAGQAAVTVGKFGWEATKTTLKTARTAAGLTLDTLGAETKSVFDVGFGLANGNSVKEIASEVGNNFVQVGKNWEKGKSGSQILGTAKDYFDAAEHAGGALFEAGAEKAFGKGNISWLAGHAGNLTVNLFTCLGKGITKVANPDSSNGEIAEGALDIAMSFIGGSKVIAKGSQVAKGSTEAVKLFGEGGINLLEHTVSNSELKNLKAITADILKNTKLTPGEVQTLISNSVDLEAEQALKAELNLASKEIDSEMGKLIKKSASTVLENATTGAVKSYEEFVEKVFENSLSGIKDAIKTVLGEDAKAYIDNLIGDKVDDIIKAAVKEHIDKEPIPGIKIIPDLKDLAGKWDQGQMTVNDVQVSDEFKAEAKKEGCDISQIEAQKGKSQSLGISLSPTSDSGGNMSIKMSDGKSQSIPFTYKDGVINATYSDQGAVMTLNLNVDEVNGAYKISGPMDINYKNNSLVIKADAGASKAMPKPPATTPAASTATPAATAPAGGPPV
jgi:DNA-binding ferritin-like protein (Dps family)